MRHQGVQTSEYKALETSGSSMVDSKLMSDFLLSKKVFGTSGMDSSGLKTNSNYM